MKKNDIWSMLADEVVSAWNAALTSVSAGDADVPGRRGPGKDQDA